VPKKTGVSTLLNEGEGAVNPAVASLEGLPNAATMREGAAALHGWESTAQRSAAARPPESTCDRQQMLLLHLPQVRLVAKSIWDRVRFAVELDDLVGYGMIGLLNAVERYDPSRGILLKTYAEHRIRGAILDGLRGMDWLPRSARQRERQQRLDDAAQAQDASGCKGTRGDKSSTTVARPSEVRMEGVFAGGSLSDLERLVDARRPRYSTRNADNNPENSCARKENLGVLAQAVAALPNRHRRVIDLYYRRELSMKQIGDLLRVHESRVSQLHAAAIQRLRKQLGGIDPAPIRRRAAERYSTAVRSRAARRACSAASAA
jgi:RNA polymerase sigma factor for flagellar operon FliA